jgi:hypothetical protein
MEDRTHGREPHFAEPEFGAATGDVRENDPSLPGFTPDDEVVFRSYFQHANRFADRSYEDVRPAYQLGYAAGRNPQYEGADFESAEKDLENQWLNVRLPRDEWQTVREFAREGFERGRRIGFIAGSGALGGTPSHQRPSFADPLPENVDPTSPDSPENRAT